MNKSTDKDNKPWWKYGYVWLVIAGPTIVVLAGLITTYIAVKGVDPLVDEDYYQKGLDLNKTLAKNPSSLAPAEQARNNAQTGLDPRTGKPPVQP